jgi:hypothetical protein
MKDQGKHVHAKEEENKKREKKREMRTKGKFKLFNRRGVSIANILATHKNKIGKFFKFSL